MQYEDRISVDAQLNALRAVINETEGAIREFDTVFDPDKCINHLNFVIEELFKTHVKTLKTFDEQVAFVHKIQTTLPNDDTYFKQVEKDDKWKKATAPSQVATLLDSIGGSDGMDAVVLKLSEAFELIETMDKGDTKTDLVEVIKDRGKTTIAQIIAIATTKDELNEIRNVLDTAELTGLLYDDLAVLGNKLDEAKGKFAAAGAFTDSSVPKPKSSAKKPRSGKK